ncbi:MAG: AraC family transcriptional regulator [Oscillospiraceae bacterium]|nr:AraC family transcriptional regulator [Oscillospiraceae bacterium]
MILDPLLTPVDSSGREQVRHGSSDFPIACYHNDLVLLPVLLHWHEELEAGIITEGSAVISIGNEKHILQAGQGFFINTGVLHDAYPAGSGPCQIHSMVFHPRLVGGSTDSVFYRRYLKPLMDDPILDWYFLMPENQWQREALEAIETAWNNCREEVPGFEFSVRNALSSLLWQLYNHRSSAKLLPNTKSLRDTERIKLMLSFIHENYCAELTTHIIAASAMISESECLRCFRATVGTTPIQYLKQHRLRQAATQLLSTPDKVSEIAARCGFQDMSYFTKSFREQEGCSPKEYRKNKNNL